MAIQDVKPDDVTRCDGRGPTTAALPSKESPRIYSRPRNPAQPPTAPHAAPTAEMASSAAGSAPMPPEQSPAPSPPAVAALRLSPITLSDAHVFVRRHHRPAQGGLFAVAATDGSE